MDVGGAVEVGHHQFVVGAVDADFTQTRDEGQGLLASGPGFVLVRTGVATGPVRVRVQTLDAAPASEPDPRWEVVEEAPLTSRKPMVVTSEDGNPAEWLDPLPAGQWRVRAHARGRDILWDQDVAEPPEAEEHLLQLWPTGPGRARQVLLRKTDQAWSPRPPVPVPDWRRTYVYGPDGAVLWVDTESPQAEQFRERRYGTWGGGGPIEGFARPSHASVLAGLDRELVERLAAADPQHQRNLARWAIRKIAEKAGFGRVGWAREALDALDAGLPLPPRLDSGAKAMKTLHDDPAVVFTLSEGLPGSGGDGVQEHFVTALFSYYRNAPLDAAAEALYKAASVHGVRHGELLAEAHHVL